MNKEELDEWERRALGSVAQYGSGADVKVPNSTMLSLIAAARELESRRWVPAHGLGCVDGIGGCIVGEYYLCLLESTVNSVPIVLEYVGDGYFVDPESPDKVLSPELLEPRSLPSAPEQTKETP